MLFYILAKKSERSDFRNGFYLNKPNAERSGTRHSELETLQKKLLENIF